MVTLPDGVDACDIGTITVWCQPFRAIFTRLAIPRSIFVRDSERKGGRERGEGERGGGGREGGRERGGGDRGRDGNDNVYLASICYYLGTSVTYFS